MSESNTQLLEHSPNQERRNYDDTTTWVSEVLNGSMRTSFEYTSDGQELYGHDGLPLSPVFNDAIVDARRIARTAPNLRFELRRRLIEAEEFSDILAMARGEGPNTIIVVSDFPPELMDATKDVGGYSVTRKQTMLRIIARQPDGTIRTSSQSLEGSDRDALESIYDALDQKAKPGELLGQRVKRDFAPEEQELLMNSLMGVHDRVLESKHGGKYYAGWKLPDDRALINTYDFVCQQQDLLAGFRHLQANNANSKSVLYGLAAAMRERFERHLQGRAKINPAWLEPSIGSIVDGAIYEMSGAGRAAQEAGMIFSGCGETLEPDNKAKTLSEMNSLGYGNKTSEKLPYKFDKDAYCVECQNPPKAGEDKKKCGPCDICEPCDTKIRVKEAKKQQLMSKAWLN